MRHIPKLTSVVQYWFIVLRYLYSDISVSASISSTVLVLLFFGMGAFVSYMKIKVYNFVDAYRLFIVQTTWVRAL